MGQGFPWLQLQNLGPNEICVTKCYKKLIKLRKVTKSHKKLQKITKSKKVKIKVKVKVKKLQNLQKVTKNCKI
jgi:hypothetical protein